MPDPAITPDTLITDSMGNFGYYQFFIIFLLFLHKFPAGFHLLIIILHSPPVGKFNCTDPSKEPCDPACPGHDFDHSVWKKTTIHQWDLVCEKKVFTSIVQSMTMFGILVGNITFGYLGDRFGRVKPIAVAATLQLIVGVAAGLSPWFWMFASLRFLIGVATGGTMVPTFALLLEFTPKRWRTLVGIWSIIPFHFAHSLLGLVGYIWRRWDYQQFAVSSFSVCLLTYWCFLPESPRWLLEMNRHEEVINILERGAKCNKMPTEHIKGMVDKYMDSIDLSNSKKRAGNVIDLFWTKRMRTKTLVMCFIWYSTALSFYAVGQYVGRMPGNFFINTLIVGLMQVPANLFGGYIIGCIGRKWSVVVSYLITVCPLFVIGFLPKTPVYPTVTLGIISMCGAAMNFALIYVYTCEILPTLIRSVGMGLCSMIGRIGSMTCPFIFNLPVPEWARPLIFAIAPVIALTMTLIWMPETMNRPLPDTIEEADAI